MDFKNIKAVIFDFDGTLYDFKGVTKNLLKNLSILSIIRAGKERKLRHIYKGKYFGSSEEFYFSYFQDLAKLCHTTPQKIQNWYENVYLEEMINSLKKNYNFRKNADKVFSILKANKIKTAVFSDYPKVQSRMEAIGFKENTADFLFSAENLGGLKPSVEPFFKIAEKLDVNPVNILFVGDRSDTDGKGAVSSGMNFIQILTDKTPDSQKSNAVSWEDFVHLIEKNF